MEDVSNPWSADMGLGPTGDLGLVSDAGLGQQRVLRRLLTTPGEYIWHLDYGAGLGRFVGRTTDEGKIRAAIRSQIFKEAAVAKSPEPTIVLQSAPDGSLYVTIQYMDAPSGTGQILAFSVT